MPDIFAVNKEYYKKPIYFFLKFKKKLTYATQKKLSLKKMANNYRHNWSIRDYKILFAVCRGNEEDANRVAELLKVFPNNRANDDRKI